MNAVLDNDNLLELILFQLDGEVAGILTRIADAEGLTDRRAADIKSVPQAARRAHAAALASRLVCRRWKAHSGSALANTRVRFRLAVGGTQALAAFYAGRLSEEIRLSRRADAQYPIASDLTTQSAFLASCYQIHLERAAGTNADAAIGQIRHVLGFKVAGRFVIYTAQHKLASWQRRLREELPGATISVYGTNDDLGEMQRLARGQTEISVVSYTVAGSQAFGPDVTPGSAIFFKFVIFDDARQFMWRPNLKHIFHPTNAPTAPVGLLLDDFYTRPCTLSELFKLAILLYPQASGTSDPDRLQAHIMEALDPFNFTEAVVDRLLRPQLMDALRHAMCK